MPRPLVLLVALGLSAAGRADDPKPLKALFLGDRGHHRPADRFKQLDPAFAKRGIQLTYTEKADDLNAETLAGYDALIVYANTTKITPTQEKALLDFVEGGRGFVPLHCASYCFLNSPKYIDLVGAQFRSHGIGTFRATVAAPDHPVMKGFTAFESWDETYVHTKHNEKDRTVLEYRVSGDVKEPWTWVRTQGKGRVFYTAWGHDHRTWGHPGFQELVERGLRWAAGQDPQLARSAERGARNEDTSSAPRSAFRAPNFPVPEMTAKRSDVTPFEYDDVGKKIPNYTPSRQWGVQGEPYSKMQRPLPADESRKHVVVPKGFRAELFVTEKELGGKPICMAWDERGRLWAALTLDYPNELRPPAKGRDRVVVCEDADGDGRGDTVTVFAEGLSIPTSLFFARGGVVAFDATQTVFLKDADGDGKAESREVLFGTWNQRDTHGGPSNMQYGLDNWVWAMQGYNDSRLTVGGEPHRFRQGFFRFRTDGSKLEFVRSTDNNTWGLGISEEGIVFGSTANRNPSVYMPIPNRYYEAVRGWTPSLVSPRIADTHLFRPITDKVRQVDQHGGYTAAAGHALYTARNYPQEYWNRTAFVAEPTGHLVGAFVIRQEGSHFRSSNPFNLFASDDEWAAPIMAEVGPDGNVWVLDWYNFIVQHNPTPQGFRTGKGAAYESDLRDKTHGRIYRVLHDSTGSVKDTGAKLSLAGATPDQLVSALSRDNLFWRRHAQRLLVERGNKDVVPALCALARESKVDAVGLNVGAIHALWTLHGLGALDGSAPEATAAAVAALKHPSAGVRRNAVQVLPRTGQSVDAILAAGLVRDPDPQVRLMALLALADQPPAAAAGAAVAEALGRPENASDRWIPDAATCAAARNGEHFLRAVAATKQPGEKLLGVTAVVAEHYARGGPVDSAGAVVAKLADADPAAADAAVRGLARGWPAKAAPKLDDATEAALEKLTARLAPERRALVVRLAAAWGSKRVAKFGA
jgi:putative membrane-bound dehydrogenase-like protein